MKKRLRMSFLILKEKIEHQRKLLSEEQEEYKEISEELLSLLNEYKTSEQTLNENKQSLRIRNERVNSTINELERAKAKQSSLQEMQENYAGYYAGVRAVMQQKGTLEGIVGTVAELVKYQPNTFKQLIQY